MTAANCETGDTNDDPLRFLVSQIVQSRRIRSSQIKTISLKGMTREERLAWLQDSGPKNVAIDTSGLTADEFKMLLGVETTFVEIETE